MLAFSNRCLTGTCLALCQVFEREGLQGGHSCSLFAPLQTLAAKLAAPHLRLSLSAGVLPPLPRGMAGLVWSGPSPSLQPPSNLDPLPRPPQAFFPHFREEVLGVGHRVVHGGTIGESVLVE